MDELIDYEEKEAEKCKKIHTSDTCPSIDTGSRARADTGTPLDPNHVEHDNADTYDSEEDEDEDEPDELQDTTAEDQEAKDGAASEESGPELPVPTTQNEVNPCDIVSNLFSNPEQFKEVACKQKYAKNNSRLGWKCIPSGDNTTTGGEGSGATVHRSKRGADSQTPSKKTTPPSNSGSICVPPRRRKLYVGGLTKWANETLSSGESSAGGKETPVSGEARGPTAAPTSPPSSNSRADGLLTAFVESAAVETFFLWDRYKKENTKKTQSVGLPLLPLPTAPDSGSGEQNPQSQLLSGNIPPPFLRQMFYTLGDYRDICVGNTPHGIDTVSASDKDTMENIKKAIEKILSQNGDKLVPQKSVNDRQSLWETYAEPIWNGMIYALTYDTNSGAKDQPPQQDTKVKGQLWDDTNKKPKKDNNHDYTYENVVLKEEVNGAKGNDDIIQTPTLKNFVKIPTFFRWLHEWGSDFCGKRARMLKNVKKACRKKDDGGDKNCSGDGENCETIREQDYTILPDFNCPGCGRECRKYKQWIRRKKYEFIEQQNAFTKQKDKCEKESKGAESKHHSISDQNFVKKLGTDYTSIKLFLQKLVSCSKNDSEEGNGKGKKIFDDEGETFAHAKDCKPCSQFKVNCNGNGACKGGTYEKCSRKTFNAEDIIKNKEPSIQEVVMRVIDDSATGFKGDLENHCKNADIFKGVREDKWKCFYVCGVDICKPEESNDFINDKEYIQIRALFKRWLEYFLEDYNKIKNKLKPCINKETNKLCINGCYKNCECVGQWISKKRTEWGKIKKRYFDQYNVSEQKQVYNVKSFLEGLQSQIAVTIKKAIKPCGNLDDFQDSKECAVAASSGKKDGEKSDVVECLLDRLKNKIDKCKEDHSSGDQTKTACQESPSVEEDEEDLLLEENENPVVQPKICGEMKEETKEQEEGDECKAVTPSEPGEKKKEEEKEDKEEEKDKGDQPEEAASRPTGPPLTPIPGPQPPQIVENPLVIPALVTSTLAWSVGIGFAAFTYFYLK
ncbi:hypothetical protein PFMC_06024, partial [Plasmodium falciparum CAMP/Malaysia]